MYVPGINCLKGIQSGSDAPKSECANSIQHHNPRHIPVSSLGKVLYAVPAQGAHECASGALALSGTFTGPSLEGMLLWAMW